VGVERSETSARGGEVIGGIVLSSTFIFLSSKGKIGVGFNGFFWVQWFFCGQNKEKKRKEGVRLRRKARGGAVPGGVLFFSGWWSGPIEKAPELLQRPSVWSFF